jgi:hypothetical protein
LRNQLTEKILGGSGSWRPKVEPVREVIAHVVTGEGKHGERIAANFADISKRGSGHFRSHGRSLVHAERPVERLKDKRDDRVSTAAENER